jgi:hypothetical protein
MNLPEPIERSLERGPERMPLWLGRWRWRRLFPSTRTRSLGGTVVELNYDVELPPWIAGPYRQDVPK